MSNQNSNYNNRDEEYFASIKYGTFEWYLYHDRSNEDPIIPLVLVSAFLSICNGGFLCIIIIWCFYFSWAHKNNVALDKDPYILGYRKAFRDGWEKRRLENKK